MIEDTQGLNTVAFDRTQHTAAAKESRTNLQTANRQQINSKHSTMIMLCIVQEPGIQINADRDAASTIERFWGHGPQRLQYIAQQRLFGRC